MDTVLSLGQEKVDLALLVPSRPSDKPVVSQGLYRGLAGTFITFALATYAVTFLRFQAPNQYSTYK